MMASNSTFPILLVPDAHSIAFLTPSDLHCIFVKWQANEYNSSADVIFQASYLYLSIYIGPNRRIFHHQKVMIDRTIRIPTDILLYYIPFYF